jgi:tRNA nucleotidyltransferase/poly(A) polymerase
MAPKDLDREILGDPILLRLSNLAKKEKVPLFLVGGYLRDLWLSRQRRDYDFVLPREASPFITVIETAFQIRFFRVGKEKETTTFRMVQADMSMDITFFQGQNLEEDLLRRDFTINTLAYSLKDGTWHWAKGALDDIENHRIRAVTDRSIEGDPLRMLRAIRYLCTLDDFSMDEHLKQEISSKRDLISKIAGERIRMELDRILLSPRQSKGMKSLNETGLLITLFPELRGLQDLGQDEHHHLNALSHTLLAVEKIPWAVEWARSKRKNFSLCEEDLISLSYAMLFHDLGKQDTYSKDEKKRVHFYHHEVFSCQAAEGITERLRFSNPMRERVLRLIRNHMRILNLSPLTKETALRRVVHEMGHETPLVVLHSLADKEASRGVLSLQNDEVVENHCLHLLELFSQEEILHPPPLITGRDILALGYSAGPRVGEILSLIRQKQVEGEIKTREEAIAFLRERFGIDPEG